jgi:Heavy metal associated domain 2
MMPPTGRITHRMNGRVRLRIPEKRRDSEYFSRLQQTLSRCEGVDAVVVNPVTASALITGSADADEVVVFGENSELFRLETGRFIPFSERLNHQLHRVDERVRDRTGGQLDLNSVAFIGLMGAGLWQMSRRRILPEALTVLWYAYSLLTNPQQFSPSPSAVAADRLDS